MKPKDTIPPNIMAAARRAGLSAPLWYVGRRWNPNHKRQKTLADLAEESRARVAAPSTSSEPTTPTGRGPHGV